MTQTAQTTSIRNLIQWVGHKGKQPINPHTGRPAKVNDPATWGDYDTAVNAMRQYQLDGIGFVFTRAAGITGIDLDRCIDTAGNLSPLASEVVTLCDSYTEVSPSGSGLHILVGGSVPAAIKRPDIEIYSDGRYFTYTGDVCPGSRPDIHSRQAALDELVSRFSANGHTAASASPGAVNAAGVSLSLSDHDLLQKAAAAVNGEKFNRLFAGDTAGYASHSEADLALCNLLAFWAGGDAATIDRLFRQSQLYRPEKWGKQHASNGATYGQMTIAKALNGTTDFYQPGTYTNGHTAGSSTRPAFSVGELVNVVIGGMLQNPDPATVTAVNEHNGEWFYTVRYVPVGENGPVECTYAEPQIEPITAGTPADNGQSQATASGAAGGGGGPTVPPVSLSETLPLADLNFIKQCLDEEEMGDGKLLAHVYSGRLVYDHTARRGDGWHLWSGHSWQRDEKGIIRLLYSAQVADQYLRAAGEWGKQAAARRSTGNQTAGHIGPLDKLQERAQARTRQLRKVARTGNALDYASRYPGVAVTSEVWDCDPYLLGVENGVIDLRTGTFTAGRPSDFIRTTAPTSWAGIDAPAPRFERFISEIMGHDKAMVAFLHRLLGYGISGLTTEHVFPIFWGADGRNGKDTLLETLGGVLGSAAGAVSKDVILAFNRPASAGAATPHLAALHGRRLVWASEPNEGARLDAGAVKLITGGGRIRARELHANEIEFSPSHLLILVTNPKPHMPADDNALWERVLLIPFEQRFLSNPNPAAANEHQADSKLKEKLQQESSGILAWLVRGFLAWQSSGLNAPDTVKAATETYREEEDTIGLFLADCCLIGSKYQVRAKAFYEAYSTWCIENAVKPLTGTAFGMKMKKRFKKDRDNVSVFYEGVGLLIPTP